MGALSGSKCYQYIHIIAREIDMKQSIFKGYHFASLKEWKGRKKYTKGLVLIVNPIMVNYPTPMEILEDIKKARIILEQETIEPTTITIIPKRKSHHATDYKTTYLRKRDLLQGRIHPSKQMVARWWKHSPKLRH